MGYRIVEVVVCDQGFEELRPVGPLFGSKCEAWTFFVANRERFRSACVVTSGGDRVEMPPCVEGHLAA